MLDLSLKFASAASALVTDLPLNFVSAFAAMIAISSRVMERFGSNFPLPTPLIRPLLTPAAI
ncbi:hypothetical protein D3C76_1698610 [compost metagenome]